MDRFCMIFFANCELLTLSDRYVKLFFKIAPTVRSVKHVG